jgi:hypothetical protein
LGRYPKGSRLVKQPATRPPAPPAAIAPAAPAIAQQPFHMPAIEEIKMPEAPAVKNYRGLVTEFFEIGFNNAHLRYSKGAMIDADPGLFAFLTANKVPVHWRNDP